MPVPLCVCVSIIIQISTARNASIIKNCILFSFSFGKSDIQVSESIRNLGVIFDCNLSFNKHVNAVSRSSHYDIHDLRRIKHFVPSNILVTLNNALVSSLACTVSLNPLFNEHKTL